MLQFVTELLAWLSSPSLRGDGLVAQQIFLSLQGILEASKARDIPIVIDAVSATLLSRPFARLGPGGWAVHTCPCL